MNIMAFFKLLIDLLKLLKDSDADGRPDIFDSEPNNPEVK